MQDVSNTIQTEGKKLGGWKAAIQTQVTIKIEKSNSTHKPVVNYNEVNYFLSGPNQGNDNKVLKSQSKYKRFRKCFLAG